MNYSVSKAKKVGKFIIASRKIIWIDEFVCSKSMAYSFTCGDKILINWKVLLNLNQKI